MNRGTMGVNSLPKTVTRQRRACDFWTQALLRMSPAWVRFLMCNTDLVHYRWTGLDLLTADRLKMQDWKIVISSKYSLSCCTYVFHRCGFVLTYSVLAYSILRYFRFPYLRFQSPHVYNLTAMTNSTCVTRAVARRSLRVYTQTGRDVGIVYTQRSVWPHGRARQTRLKLGACYCARDARGWLWKSVKK